MTQLTILTAAGATAARTAEPAAIAARLRDHGIFFERWPLAAGAAPDRAGPDRGDPAAAVLDAYREPVRQLARTAGYQFIDVVHIDAAAGADTAAARAAFRAEHVHGEDEVRFFARGRGCFYLHLDGQVYAVICEAGDLLSVPAGIRHWFDMGERPSFTAIRFFRAEDGWAGDFTGNPIAARLPDLDELLEPTS